MVTGIEGRGDLIKQFSRYPDGEAKSRVTILEGDFLTEMDRLRAEGKHFDVVTCLGVFYHTIQHYRMLMQMVASEPKVIVVDGDFDLSDKPMISVRLEDTGLNRATIAGQEGQALAPVGRISRPAFEMMVDTLAYSVEWNEWDVPEKERDAVMDYFDKPRNNLRRFTCLLRPA